MKLILDDKRGSDRRWVGLAQKLASVSTPIPTQYKPQSPYKVHYTPTGARYPEGKNDRHKFNF